MPIPNSFAAGSARAFGFLGNVSPSDPYFNYVTMLLPGNGTNGAQNNTFLDSSTNNFTVTRNGNTTQGTFSPYGNLWSNYFDGSGDSLTVATGTAFDFVTGDFTIEFWINPSNTSSAYRAIVGSNNYAATTGGWTIYQNGTSLELWLSPGTVVTLNATSAITASVWQHIALSRSSGTLRLFVNGTSVASASNATTFTGNIIYVGTNAGLYYFNGYISNLRIINGTAVYTSAFTPPTSPLTAISGTSLLTCQSNRFIDNSSNAFTITRNGDVSVQRFSPFAPTAPYAAGTDGGSGYFDGSGDYLTVASGSAANLSSGDFTVELWFYPTVGGLAISLFQQGEAFWRLNMAPSNQINWVVAGAVGITSTNTFNINSWNHVAVSKSGSTQTLYLNGIAQGTTTTSPSNSNNDAVLGINTASIGNVWPFAGYISNARIVKGTAVYTANFTPPTAPPTAITNTSLLLNFTNAGIIDNAEMNNLETVGNAQISTAQSKFGGGSMYFDGTGDGVYAPSSQNFALQSDFTIEFWLYQTATSGEGTAVYNPTTNGFNVFMSISGNWGIARSNVAIDNNFGTTPTFNTWNHIAISRSTGTIRAFVNGNQVFSGTNTTSYVAGPLQIGISGFGSITGYIDDLRITKGYARYTANFTPPAAPFPTK